MLSQCLMKVQLLLKKVEEIWRNLAKLLIGETVRVWKHSICLGTESNFRENKKNTGEYRDGVKSTKV